LPNWQAGQMGFLLLATALEAFMVPSRIQELIWLRFSCISLWCSSIYSCCAGVRLVKPIAGMGCNDGTISGGGIEGALPIVVQ
jgi:hypothetical protein